MDMPDTEKLINKLSQLPELNPPANLVDEVMTKIRPARVSLLQRLLTWLSAPRIITLRPVPVFAATMLAAAVFWLGMVTGMNRIQPVTISEQINVVEKALENPQASFLAGRGLMTAGLVKEALPLLQRASLSSPENPEYAYWEGLCFWANGMPTQERSSYIRGVGSSPDAVPLLLNLGHNLMERGEFKAALIQYNKTLDISPDEQAALYNRGLIYHLQQDPKNEIAALKTYLQYHRSGENAFRAVERLNKLDDFTYRTYQLGNRKTILSQSALLGILATNKAYSEVEILAGRLRNEPKLNIDIVFFQDNDALKARQKAIVLKKNILALLGEKDEQRVKLSWFGEKETIETAGKLNQLPESLLLFGRLNGTQGTETKI